MLTLVTGLVLNVGMCIVDLNGKEFAKITAITKNSVHMRVYSGGILMTKDGQVPVDIVQKATSIREIDCPEGV